MENDHKSVLDCASQSDSRNTLRSLDELLPGTNMDRSYETIGKGLKSQLTIWNLESRGDDLRNQMVNSHTPQREQTDRTLQDSRKSLRDKTSRLLFESQAISRKWALCQHRALGICSCQSQTSKQTQHPLDTEKGSIQIHHRPVNLGAEILKKWGSWLTVTFLNKKKEYLVKNSIHLSNIKVD